MFTSLFIKIPLYLNVTCLIVKPKLGHEFGLFSKKKFPQVKMNCS